MSNYLATPSTRAQVITRRTYNRPTDDTGQVFESWTDTVDRVIGHQRWLWTRAKETELTADEENELQELRALMISRKVSTSGRTLWLGGTDLSKRREASQFNPLPLSTKFISNVGVQSFEDLNDGDRVRVITHTKRWQDAVFMSAGMRDMRRLHLRRVRSTVVQDTSADHTWLLKDGQRVKAEDLKIGDQLYRAPAANFYDWDFDKAQPDEQIWWCYGFVYGDGTMAKSGNSVTSRVRLCGDKAAHLEKFKMCGFGFSYPPSCGGDPYVWTGAYQKTLPDSEKDDDRLIKAFLSGYLAADGHKKDQRGQTIITGLVTASDKAADFVCRWLPMFGVYVLKDDRVRRETNYGEFIGRELSFTTFGSVGGHPWTVEKIEQAEPELCACLTVEEDHSFVLPNGVVTGNCSFLRVETVSDIADAFWLLLQGCGVGFEPIPGILNGFPCELELEIIPSTRTEKGGAEYNKETLKKGIWTIKVGDSAEAWSKVPAKVLANKGRAKKLILDFSELRPAGERLKGYGWISSGYSGLAKAMTKIVEIMNRRHGDLLTRIDIMDIMNWLGTTLSSRRSAEITVVPWGDPEAEAFAVAKRNWWEGNEQRAQSNNSVMFGKRPTKYELHYVFGLMEKGGGSEPGFLNAEEAYRRAPWFKGVNPCAEILLGNKSFCNLVETDLGKFNGDYDGLLRALHIVARANYRQTCVDLRDEVLQKSWHELNTFLRLCGVGLTGIVRWEFDGDPSKANGLKLAAQGGANSMADELGLARAKAVTTIKPSGTLSKVMDTTEGVHKPLGRYIFNNVNFNRLDPVVTLLRNAGYRVFANPTEPDAVLVTFPVAYEDVEFDIVDGKHVNLESAVSQLNRYKFWMDNYVDHNCSITISYSVDEVTDIIEWLVENWGHYVGVSFIYRNDPTKTAADLGYLYLPQEVVTEEVYNSYASGLSPIDLNEGNSFVELIQDECATGACPIK